MRAEINIPLANFGKMKRKGQMKIQQMAFMLIAVTLFFVFVALFFASAGLSGLKQKKATLDEDNAILIATNLAKSPEFSCGGAFGTTKLNCIDFDKVMVLSERSEYFSFWDVEGIEIRKVYPASDKECTIENYPDCGVLTIKQSESVGKDKSTFVSLCHKEQYETTSYNKCEIGQLIVRFGGEE